MRTRGTVVGLVGLLVLGGCGSVIIDDDDDDDIATSGAGPADAAAVGSGSGAGGAPSTGSGSGAGDAAAGQGGGPIEPSLVWGDASTLEVTASGGIGDVAALAWPGYEPVPLLLSHREGENLEVRTYVLKNVLDAWEGTPSLEHRFDHTMSADWPEREGLVAAPMLGHAYDGGPTPGWRVALNKPGLADGTRADEVAFRELLHDGPRQHTRDAAQPLVRAIAAATDGETIHYGYVLGEATLAVETRKRLAHETHALETDVACADRRIAVAGLGLDDHFAVVHAAGGSPCGTTPLPPDTVEAIFFAGDGELTARSEAVPVGAPIAEIQVARAGDSLWIAARVEGDGGLELVRMSLDGALVVRTRLALADGRVYALATWKEEVVVVDAGRDADEASGLRARVVDASGATTMTSAPLARSGREITTVAAVGSPDDDAVLVAFSDRLEESGDRLRYGVVRADVTGSR